MPKQPTDILQSNALTPALRIVVHAIDLRPPTQGEFIDLTTRCAKRMTPEGQQAMARMLVALAYPAPSIS